MHTHGCEQDVPTWENASMMRSWWKPHPSPPLATSPLLGLKMGRPALPLPFVVAISTLFQVSPLLGLWAFLFPSNYVITSQHAAGIVRETATASTTMVTSKTLISGVLLINSSGIVLCGMITLKCLITNLYVMMHFNYFGLVQYYWALFPRFLALGLGCTQAVPWMLVPLNYLRGMGEIQS